MNAYLVSIRNLRRAQAIKVFTAAALAFIYWLAVGDLSGRLGLLAMCGVPLAVLSLLAHDWHNRRILEPVRLVYQRTEQGESIEESVLQAAQMALRGYRRREIAFSWFSWLLAAVVLLLVLVLGDKLSGWQSLVLLAGLALGGVCGMVAGAAVDTSGLRDLRRWFHRRWPRAAVGQAVTLRSFLMWAVMIMVAGLLAFAVFWMGQLQRQRAAGLLTEGRRQLQQVLQSLSQVKKKTQRTELRARALLGQRSTAGHRFYLLDNQGELLAGPAVEPGRLKWLRYLNSSGSRDWLSAPAPFVYLAQELGGGRVLFWTAATPLLDDGLLAAMWRGVLVALLLVLTTVFLLASVKRAAYHSLLGLAERIREMAAGKWEIAEVSHNQGELTILGRALNELADRQGGQFRELSAEISHLQRVCQQLGERIGNNRQRGEQRLERVEQTATSVMEMRSAIQSISEQLETLHETSADTSSAMFEIDRSVREVAQAAENLQSLVDDTASAIGQVTVSMGEVLKRVENLEALAEESVASLHVIDDSVRLVQENTQQTHKLAEQVTELASKGVSSVRQTITGINEIKDVTGEAESIINRLGGQMDAVGKILTVIGDVAEQTNLLALNAAIIAAAAGEHGKGFAVVADEIKELADRTSTSTKEISGLIRGVQSDSRLAIDAVQRGSGSVRKGVELANRADRALQQILESVRQVTQMANSIAKSIGEHSSMTQSIAKSMNQMSEMVHLIKRAVSEQSAGGSRIHQVSEQMREDSRFVQRSASEQVKAVEGVSRNMEKIADMLKFIGKAMTEQSSGVEHISKVAEDVRNMMEEERTITADIEELASRLCSQASTCGELLGGVEEEEEASARDE